MVRCWSFCESLYVWKNLSQSEFFKTPQGFTSSLEEIPSPVPFMGSCCFTCKIRICEDLFYEEDEAISIWMWSKKKSFIFWGETARSWCWISKIRNVLPLPSKKTRKWEIKEILVIICLCWKSRGGFQCGKWLAINIIYLCLAVI